MDLKKLCELGRLPVANRKPRVYIAGKNPTLSTLPTGLLRTAFPSPLQWDFQKNDCAGMFVLGKTLLPGSSQFWKPAGRLCQEGKGLLRTGISPHPNCKFPVWELLLGNGITPAQSRTSADHRQPCFPKLQLFLSYGQQLQSLKIK